MMIKSRIIQYDLLVALAHLRAGLPTSARRSSSAGSGDTCEYYVYAYQLSARDCTMPRTPYCRSLDARGPRAVHATLDSVPLPFLSAATPCRNCVLDLLRHPCCTTYLYVVPCLCLWVLASIRFIHLIVSYLVYLLENCMPWGMMLDIVNCRLKRATACPFSRVRVNLGQTWC